ncbi:ubiquitin 3 binding protein But2 C-terminal domain-containing protein [Xylariaceae sp. AK1471]|nr:ubiquitin 3 binding protein But2 C-terminal domain-containing protein [Xylariaceae sp. AK1471]
MLQRTLLLTSALSLGGARALTMRQSGCSFHISTEGSLTAPVGQYESGQTRAGPNDTPAEFTLTGDAIRDSQGRGCWWTPPALVLQCDVGQIPETGFDIGCDGAVSYNGQSTFYKCDTGEDDVKMIYLEPNGSVCGEITLHADGCYPSSCGGGSGSGSGTTSAGQSSIATAPTASGSASPGGPGSGYPVYTPGSGSGTFPTSSSPGATSPGQSGTGYSAAPTNTGSPTGSGSGPSGSGSGSAPGSPAATPSTLSLGNGAESSSAPSVTTGEGPNTGSATIPGYPAGTPNTPGGNGGGTGGESSTSSAPGSPSGSAPGYPTESMGQTTVTSPSAPPGSSAGSPSSSAPAGSSSGSPSGSASGSPSGSAPGYPASGTPGQSPVASPSYPSGTASGSPSGSAPGSPSSSTAGIPSASATGQSNSSSPSSPSGSAPGSPVYTPPASTTTVILSTSGGQSGSPSGTPTGGAPSETGTPGESCPGELTGAWEYPHLIIPVDKSAPNTAPGTSFFGEVSSTKSSAFNFDIPSSDKGKTCKLVFYFPEKSQLETSSYNFSGSGAVNFARLSKPVTESTSYATLPSVAHSYGQKTVAPGNAYTIDSFACPAGERISFEMSAAAGDDSTDLRFFQDWNPCPIGMFITVSE